MKGIPRLAAVLLATTLGLGSSAYEVVPTDGCNDGFAIYVSLASEQAFPSDARLTNPAETQEPLVRYCRRRGYGVSVVKPDTLSDLAKYKIVFLSGLCAVSGAEATALRRFAENGGLLVADTDVGLLDGSLRPCAENPLKDLFGNVLLDHLGEAKSREVSLEMPECNACGKGGALKFGFTLAAALKVRREAAVDAYLDEILKSRGVTPLATCSGLGARGVFRARRQRDCVLIGFTTTTEDLGKAVSIEFAREGFVYACGRGFVGKLQSLKIDSLDSTDGLYAWFESEQDAPSFSLTRDQLAPGQTVELDTSALRLRSRCWLEVIGPGGAELPKRKKYFTATGTPVTCFVQCADAVGDYVLKVTDVLTGLSGERKLTVCKRRPVPPRALRARFEDEADILDELSETNGCRLVEGGAGVCDSEMRGTFRAAGDLPTEGWDGSSGRGDLNGSLFAWPYCEVEAGRPLEMLRRYLRVVGNGGAVRFVGSVQADGRPTPETAANRDKFEKLRKLFFSHQVAEDEFDEGGDEVDVSDAGEFNAVVLREDLSEGEQIDGWELWLDAADGTSERLLSGVSVGVKRIRLLERPVSGAKLRFAVTSSAGDPQEVAFRLYRVDPRLVSAVGGPQVFGVMNPKGDHRTKGTGAQ